MLTIATRFLQRLRLPATIAILTIVSFPAMARSWKLDYKLSGVIVEIELKDYLLYTDMAAVEAQLTENGVIDAGSSDSSDLNLFALITAKRSQGTGDTIRLACWELMGWDHDVDDEAPVDGEGLGFREWNQMEYARTLYPQELIIMLAEAKKLRIYNKLSRRDVRTIRATDEGSHDAFDLRVAYIDPVSSKEIFAAVHYISMGNPKF